MKKERQHERTSRGNPVEMEKQTKTIQIRKGNLETKAKWPGIRAAMYAFWVLARADLMEELHLGVSGCGYFGIICRELLEIIWGLFGD